MNHLTETQLNEYLDQMLDENLQQKVQAHLDTCEQCQAELAELEILFATLNELPEVPLTRDLTPGVLAHLPKPFKIPNLWRQPAFLMQSLLTAILVGTSIPMIQNLLERIPRFESTLTLSDFALPTWTEIIAEFTLLLTWRHEFEFSMPELVFEFPELPTLPASQFTLEPGIMFGLVAVATIMWGLGNFSLLRNKPEVRK
jgi:hypothetical protein